MYTPVEEVRCKIIAEMSRGKGCEEMKAQDDFNFCEWRNAAERVKMQVMCNTAGAAGKESEKGGKSEE